MAKSHESSSPKRKEGRARSWARGEQAKVVRRQENERRARVNRERGFTARELRRALAWRDNELPFPVNGDNEKHSRVLVLANKAGVL